MFKQLTTYRLTFKIINKEREGDIFKTEFKNKNTVDHLKCNVLKDTGFLEMLLRQILQFLEEKLEDWRTGLGICHN